MAESEEVESVYALANLAREAGNRAQVMLNNGRDWEGDVANTLSGKIVTLLNENADAGLAKEIKGLGDEALEKLPEKGPYLRRHLAAHLEEYEKAAAEA
jgi:hypothetical protein